LDKNAIDYKNNIIIKTLHMTNELITTAVADSKKAAPEHSLRKTWIAVLVFLAFLFGLIALAAHNLAVSPEPWNAITNSDYLTSSEVAGTD